MKLRTAYFCRNCDEEIKFGKYGAPAICPHCEYSGGDFGRSILYEWKVEVAPPFKKIEVEYNFIGGFKEGSSCPIGLMDRLSGFEKPKEIDEKTKTISRKGRKVSAR